ncbi:hypothetical protein BKA58DRAFT_398536 [Alternaria rosae]|uniref:uncharacterized protein n=1 Tax=Alternaria rosae TaxID=1187941 RepID=UPI001E8E31DE|nr:uncharacterized protein BKA58DRAFT_398536 [Alternaria rosae]KAH6878491.1 hypothetical protein BKA58DRAFT_398536 [Alternaria rosae]
MDERSDWRGSDPQAPTHHFAAPFQHSTHGNELAQNTNSATLAALQAMESVIVGNVKEEDRLATRRFQASQYLHISSPRNPTEIYELNETGGLHSSLAGDLHLGPIPTLLPQHTEAATTQRQNQAIFNFLSRGTDPKHILDYVENFRIMLLSGNFHDLAIMAEIPSEELAKRVEDVVSHSNPTTVVDPPKIKREPPDEKPNHPPTHADGSQKSKRAKLRDATNKKPQPPVYGCLGNGGKCQERKHRYWRSKKEFRTHFETHLEDYDTPEGFKCPACEKRMLSPGIVSITTTSFSHGRDLAMHVWFEHMVPSTTSKQPQDTSLVAKGEPREGSTARQDEPRDLELGSHFQNTIEMEENGDEPWECPDTQHGQPGVSELNLWSVNDSTYSADAASRT